MVHRLAACFTASFFLFPLADAMAALPDAAFLVPPAMEAPIKTGLLKFFQLATFYGHLILVSVVLGSVILAVFDSRASLPQGKGLLFMPRTLALAVNFGVAPFLFLQVAYGRFLYPSVVLMAVWWVSIVFAVILAYYGLYVSAETSPRGRGPVLWLTLAMLMLTAFFLTNMSTLLIRPDRWMQWFEDPHGAIINLSEPSLFPRYLHMLVGSTAIGGLALAWRARWGLSYGYGTPEEAHCRIRHGMAWFFYASITQATVGVVFLFTLPEEVRRLFLGGSALHTMTLVFALSGLILALVTARQGKLRRTTAMAAAIVLLMICVRELVRETLLAPYGDKAPAPIPLAMPEGQGAAFLLFLGSLVSGALVVAWILRVLSRSYHRAAALKGDD